MSPSLNFTRGAGELSPRRRDPSVLGGRCFNVLLFTTGLFIVMSSSTEADLALSLLLTDVETRSAAACRHSTGENVNEEEEEGAGAGVLPDEEEDFCEVEDF